MIRIYSEDSGIIIKPLDRNSLADAARIYNCNDTRYATGLEGNLSIHELSTLFEHTKASENEFLNGIYVRAPGSTGVNILQFAGLCSGILDASSIWIKQLSIMPESRRKGIGTKTAEIILKYAVQSKSVPDAFLSVADKNTAGLCFWKKLGFTEVRRMNKVLFGENFPSSIIIMQKFLK